MGSKTLCFHKENAHNCLKPYLLTGMATLPGPYFFTGMAGMPAMYQKRHCIPDAPVAIPGPPEVGTRAADTQPAVLTPPAPLEPPASPTACTRARKGSVVFFSFQGTLSILVYGNALLSRS